MRTDSEGFTKYTPWEKIRAWDGKYEGWLLVGAGVATLIAILVITHA